LKGLKLGLRPKVAPYAALSIPDPAPWAQRQGLAFIGGAEHAPNRDAVNWLAAHVLPALPAAGSDQICQIVGQGWRAEDLPRAGGNRLKIVGPAGCLSTVLAGVRATTAPLRYGAGIKGKVIESLAAGVPCVMSTIAAEGLELSTPLQDLVVGTSQQFADRIFELLSEERSWLEFSLAAQAWAQDRHSQAVVTAALGDILQDPRLSPLQVAS
jgi:glycosyltransferase involved in cell wall biosynthesis